ncbi:MAG: very short patch repair endonuclease [Pyrinomonadaceae bacterium]
MDVHTTEQRSRNMKAIRSTNTKMEVALAKALWARGHRYRKNDKKVFGRPDLTFKRHKLAIFVDSEFFHGKDWETSKFIIKTRRNFWWKKIEGNIDRDIVVNKQLKEIGWTVLRFWTDEVRQNLTDCIQIIETTIRQTNHAQSLFTAKENVGNNR